MKAEVKPRHPPTAEQLHILDLASRTDDNIMIVANAGTGKTDTLERVESVVRVPTVLYLVFNRKNADEAKKRKVLRGTTTINTFNGCGHRAWDYSTGGKATLDTKKMRDLLSNIIDSLPKAHRREASDRFWEVLAAVDKAKALGYIPDGIYPDATRLIDRTSFECILDEVPDELTLDLVDRALTASIKAAYAGALDYNDQIYMPALFKCVVPEYPLVMVDEYQDLNPVNHVLLDKLVKHRLIGVGDPAQNIYAFRGAKRGGMSEAQAKYSMTECSLSVSFRCPEAVVKAARWRVPNFKWIKPGGHVERLESMDADHFPDNAAIICRNNAPLFKLGMQFLTAGRSVSIAGSDVGPRLVGLMRKLGSDDTPRSALISAIEDWRAEKLARDSTTADDLADCMLVFADRGSTLGAAIAFAQHMFDQKGALRLLTGHKSKGLEFDHVTMLDTFHLRTDDQDLNLRYVMQTRSASHLYEIDSENIRWTQ